MSKALLLPCVPAAMQAVTELLSAAGEALSEADKAAAIEYGNRHGSSVRSAAAFVQAILQ
jgi:hypothetical protein